MQRASDELNGRPDPIVYVCDPVEFEKALVGRVLERACRKGKQMWWQLGGPGKHPGLHFGMTGGIAVRGVSGPKYKRYGVDATEWPPRFTRLEVGFGDGTRLAFVNSRRIGRIRLLDDPEHEPPVSLLGFDPFTSPPNAATFRGLLQARRGPIKAVLLDQSFSAGVGNWIADEVCYQARVHPARPVATMSVDVIERVRAALTDIVKTACEARADHSLFPKDWLFHVRWSKGKRPGGEAPRTLDGHPIAFSTVGGRTTASVAAVQGGKDWAGQARPRKPVGPEAAPETAGGDAAAPEVSVRRRSAGPRPPARVRQGSAASQPKQRAGTKAARPKRASHAAADATPIEPASHPSPAGALDEAGRTASADGHSQRSAGPRVTRGDAATPAGTAAPAKRRRPAKRPRPEGLAAPACAAPPRARATPADSVAARRPKRACRQR